MSWSRITETPLGLAARSVYESDQSRQYHNWAHVNRLYWHARETFDLDYDPDLDLAILAHDVIYDAAPDKERRSIAWLQDNSDTDIGGARAHILKTIEHRPSEDNRMIMLDLADFLYPDRATQNLDKIKAESQALYGVTTAQFLVANIAVMTGLYDRIGEGLPGDVPRAERTWLTKIRTGIQNNIAEAKRQLASA
ncbi:hypothetical protein [Yoonia sp. 2307UL14-13]|uniref:hypothetical protein n=1 Tax=Yoonia sp. 2307UL14-13 TaxID=3126506 RepID=UPI0030B2DF38